MIISLLGIRKCTLALYNYCLYSSNERRARIRSPCVRNESNMVAGFAGFAGFLLVGVGEMSWLHKYMHNYA